MKKDYKLILASNSPRRQQLLSELGLKFQLRSLEVEESFPAELEVDKVAEYLAIKKGRAHQKTMEADEIIITADTTVVVGQSVLNKPADEKEAFQMLQQLSDTTHQVITGVCLTLAEQHQSFRDITSVTFRKLDEEEINHYIKHYHPFDKAGGYAIQEWIGMIGITHIDGSYFNVVGLPSEKLYGKLKKII
ncbi:Maf family nucleotide pyrophosphatase [Catalinimonas alkaloidigena]|uniref:Maf family nucleotide pyrophosphatase n=1 Tax=Catalinimonas alkaloidigena TaxID=1075417 RepID=UPI002406C9CB|nr:Maf family nucleotide pyrophosphatase [Catalinimonas alkaloidigena]